MSTITSLLTDFKSFTTSRGFKYTYYFSAPLPGKPTLLFIHGFPSLALDWHHQIVHFKSKGYGLVVPNQLGYGGSDKPAEVEDYVQDRVAGDMVEILDHEEVGDVVSIGHDWCELSNRDSPLKKESPDEGSFVGAATRRASSPTCMQTAS